MTKTMRCVLSIAMMVFSAAPIACRIDSTGLGQAVQAGSGGQLGGQGGTHPGLGGRGGTGALDANDLGSFDGAVGGQIGTDGPWALDAPLGVGGASDAKGSAATGGGSDAAVGPGQGGEAGVDGTAGAGGAAGTGGVPATGDAAAAVCVGGHARAGRTGGDPGKCVREPRGHL
jgi:hypothetical protein